MRAEGPRGKLFERAEGDAVGLAQRAIDGASFGHAHLGVVEDEGRDVSRMGIAVPNEAAAFGCFKDCRFKYPEILLGSTQWKHRLSDNSLTSLALGQLQ